MQPDEWGKYDHTFDYARRIEEKELVRLCRKYADYSEEQLDLVRKNFDRVKEELDQIGDVEDIINKIKVINSRLYRALEAIKLLIHNKYYGAIRDEERPQEVHELYRLSTYLERLSYVFEKMKNHLTADENAFSDILAGINNTREMLKAYDAGFFKRHFRRINPKTKHRYHFTRGKKETIESLRTALHGFGHAFRELRLLINFNEKDLEILEHALAIVHKLGGHMHDNAQVWMRDDLRKETLTGTVTANYIHELGLLEKVLMELVEKLEEIVDDEKFVRISNVKIIKINKKEQDWFKHALRRTKSLPEGK